MQFLAVDRVFFEEEFENFKAGCGYQSAKPSKLYKIELE